MDKQYDLKNKPTFLGVFNNLDLDILQSKDIKKTVIIKPFSPILLCYMSGINKFIPIIKEDISKPFNNCPISQNLLEESKNKIFPEKTLDIDEEWILLENDTSFKKEL